MPLDPIASFIFLGAFQTSDTFCKIPITSTQCNKIKSKIAILVQGL